MINPEQKDELSRMSSDLSRIRCMHQQTPGYKGDFDAWMELAQKAIQGGLMDQALAPDNDNAPMQMCVGIM